MNAIILKKIPKPKEKLNFIMRKPKIAMKGYRVQCPPGGPLSSFSKNRLYTNVQLMCSEKTCPNR